MIHFHTAVEECEVSKLLECMVLAPKKKVEKYDFFVRLSNTYC